ncbi:hypothetical protein RJT34_31245 [Clitoria ternatea]|uniref:Uncharacterized protein n=1 Tax=Clitoria ternatea TaxID=43366 RepID=A0AAN9I873_CLITE
MKAKGLGDGLDDLKDGLGVPTYLANLNLKTEGFGNIFVPSFVVDAPPSFPLENPPLFSESTFQQKLLDTMSGMQTSILRYIEDVHSDMCSHMAVICCDMPELRYGQTLQHLSYVPISSCDGH